MNKIYKVIWNVCRGIHVVTDENHRAHGKEASSLIVPVELLVMEASLLTLPLTAVAEALDHAITVDPNWTGTTRWIMRSLWILIGRERRLPVHKTICITIFRQLT